MSRPAFRFTPEAAEQALGADAWWRENRRSSPELFATELRAAVDLAVRAPTVGQRYPSEVLPDVRRIGLQRTRSHLYFVVRGGAVVVVAVWSGVRGHGPPLSRP